MTLVNRWKLLYNVELRLRVRKLLWSHVAVTETDKPAQSHTCPDASESTNTNKTFASNVLISEEISTEINSERNRAAESPRQDSRESETNDELHELQENCEDQLTADNQPG